MGVGERDWPGTRPARRITSWRGVIERGVHSYRSQAVALSTDADGARRDFAWHGDGTLYSADRCHFERVPVIHDGSPPLQWAYTSTRHGHETF
jgi:hypothetical protein